MKAFVGDVRTSPPFYHDPWRVVDVSFDPAVPSRTDETAIRIIFLGVRGVSQVEGPKGAGYSWEVVLDKGSSRDPLMIRQELERIASTIARTG